MPTCTHGTVVATGCHQRCGGTVVVVVPVFMMPVCVWSRNDRHPHPNHQRNRRKIGMIPCGMNHPNTNHRSKYLNT